MPYHDKKKRTWTGQVKRTLNDPGLDYLESKPLWSRRKDGAWTYTKIKRNFRTKTEASSWEKLHWQEVLERDVFAKPEEIVPSFLSICYEYLENQTPRWKSANTRSYKQRLYQEAVEFWGGDMPIPIRPLSVNKFLTSQFEQCGGAKANRSLRELNTLFTWAVSNELMPSNPAAPVQRFSQRAFKKYVPPQEDIRLVLDVATGRDRDLILVAYHSLARSVEIRRLLVSDCDFEHRKIWLRTRKREAGTMDVGSVDMNATLFATLESCCKNTTGAYVFPGKSGGRMEKEELGKILPKLIRKVNRDRPRANRIREFGFHSIRHHVAAHLYLRCGYSVAELQKVLRHSRASTTDIYLKSIVDMESERGLNDLDGTGIV